MEKIKDMKEMINRTSNSLPNEETILEKICLDKKSLNPLTQDAIDNYINYLSEQKRK